MSMGLVVLLLAFQKYNQTFGVGSPIRHNCLIPMIFVVVVVYERGTMNMFFTHIAINLSYCGHHGKLFTKEKFSRLDGLVVVTS